MIHYRPIAKQDLPMAVQAIDATLGKGYYTLERITEYFDHKMINSFGAFKNDQLIGLAWTKNFTPEEQKNKVGQEVFQEDKIALDVVVVQPEFQKLGIGKTLVESLLLPQMIVFAWSTPKGINMGKILESKGFKAVRHFPKIFYKPSLELGFICPVCGSPPCYCGVVLYEAKV